MRNSPTLAQLMPEQATAPALDAATAFEDLLAVMVQAGASDLFLSAGAVPTLKVRARMTPLAQPRLARGAVRSFAKNLLSTEDYAAFERRLEHDMAVELEGLGRFRVNVFMHRGEVGMVVRHVQSRVPSFNVLRLPPVVQQLALQRQGLVLVVGAAGAGKSTTVASMLDHRIRQQPGHVLTVEDPIEFLHEHHRSIVNQREVGLDTHSFGDALRQAMREAPDVIMIGEIRDEDSLRHALHYANTGHLCITTLHANSAPQAIERMINFFPENARHGVLADLAINLKGVVALRLLEDKQGQRVPASEVMLQSGYVSDLIAKGELHQLRQAIGRAGPSSGMHTFDQSLYELVKSGVVSQDCALAQAESRTDLALRLRLGSGVALDTEATLL